MPHPKEQNPAYPLRKRSKAGRVLKKLNELESKLESLAQRHTHAAQDMNIALTFTLRPLLVAARENRLPADVDEKLRALEQTYRDGTWRQYG